MKNVNLLIPRSKSLKERAYGVLKELIFTGKLEPGNLYNESRLAESMGVSRTPVREALLELSREGMVTFMPGRGVKVQKITKEQVRDVYEIRKIIEGYVIKKITRQLTSSDLTKIRDIIVRQEKMSERKDRLAFIETDREMHFYLSAKLGNRQMDAVLFNLRDQIQRMGIKAVERDTRSLLVIGEHKEILSALERKNEKEAYDKLMLHLCNSEESLVSGIDEEEDDGVDNEDLIQHDIRR